MGKAQHLDRPPALIPNMTIVLLKLSTRLIYVTGKNTTRTVMLIRYPDCDCKLHVANENGFLSCCKLKPGLYGSSCEVKKINFTAKDKYAFDFTFHT
jgi:hypothetical protein